MDNLSLLRQGQGGGHKLKKAYCRQWLKSDCNINDDSLSSTNALCHRAILLIERKLGMYFVSCLELLRLEMKLFNFVQFVATAET